MKREFVGRGLKLETRPGQAVEPELHRSSRSNRDAQNAEDGPLPAERIRRSWEATKCAAMGPIARPGLVVWLGGLLGLGL